MVSTVASPAAARGDTAVIERRLSLSRGPALILGAIMLAAGLYFLYKQHRFPPLHDFPSRRAPVDGHVFLGVFGVNGWTGMGTAIAGGLLLFGAAEHYLAKTLSLFVGVVLAAAAIVAAISGDVFGLAAANIWTEVGWGACAVILLLNVAVPARRRVVRVAAPAPVGVTSAPDRARLDEVPASEVPVERAPASEVPVEGVPASEVPVERAPASETPVGEARVSEDPADAARAQVAEPAEVR